EPASKLPISPLAGEMNGRTEGGVKERDVFVRQRCLCPGMMDNGQGDPIQNRSRKSASAD
ncbi:hypothetical protein EN792_075435, partial [Mesorhizobium sp. M00.F.Ca.ET.149.01.1.1]